MMFFDRLVFIIIFGWLHNTRAYVTVVKHMIIYLCRFANLATPCTKTTTCCIAVSIFQITLIKSVICFNKYLLY